MRTSLPPVGVSVEPAAGEVAGRGVAEAATVCEGAGVDGLAGVGETVIDSGTGDGSLTVAEGDRSGVGEAVPGPSVTAGVGETVFSTVGVGVAGGATVVGTAVGGAPGAGVAVADGSTGDDVGVRVGNVCRQGFCPGAAQSSEPPIKATVIAPSKTSQKTLLLIRPPEAD
ncbi:MAG: hypothetical protein PVI59_07880 [Anaerolineae bacterium]